MSNFKKPEMNVVALSGSDVITASGSCTCVTGFCSPDCQSGVCTCQNQH